MLPILAKCTRMISNVMYVINVSQWYKNVINDNKILK